MKLRAERKGDEWILNGEKCFIANGSVASLFFVRTRTNPNVNVRDGSTLFLVPRDTPGFRVGKVFDKRGWRFYQNAELIFENARVPHANLVMNFSADVIQRVTRLNMDIHGAEGCMMNARVDKLVRDAMIWTHLAGDTVQRVKTIKHFIK